MTDDLIIVKRQGLSFQQCRLQPKKGIYEMRHQILNVKSLMFVFVIVSLLYSVQGIGYGQTLTASTPEALTETNLNNSVVTLSLEGAAWADISKIRNAVAVSGIEGVTIKTARYRSGRRWVCTSGCGSGVELGYWTDAYSSRPSVRRVSDTVLEVPLTFDGTDFDADATLTFTVEAAAIANYDGPALTAEVPVALYKGVSVSVTSPLTEATLDGSVATLTLDGVIYEADVAKISSAVTVSGITGVTVNTSKVQRVSDRTITVELNFDGTDFVRAVALTFSVAAGAITNYKGTALTAGIFVTASRGEGLLAIFWTDFGMGKIQRANLDGSDVQDLITRGFDIPVRIALDVAGGKMYWTNTVRAKIRRANLDGSNVEDLVTRTQGLVRLSGIALDVAGGKMYWIDIGTAKIQRANLDGSNVEDLVTRTQGLRAPRDIALDVAGGKMYWTDTGTTQIQRANLDGSNVEDLITLVWVGLNGIALDVAGGKMYWTNSGAAKIQRANLDGSNIEDLVTRTQGLMDPWDIALDVAGGKMYWTDTGTGKIQRANLDGSNIEDLVTRTQGLMDPWGIAIAIPASQQPSPQPDLVLEAVQAVPTTVAPGEKFRLYATLKNQGTAQSAATTVRYYRSTDNVISTTDTQLGTGNRNPLAPNDTLRRYLSITAPTTPGTYYYGVCVDSVTNESNTTNNCSAAVTVTVTAPVVSTDVNNDGAVDVQDLVYVAQRYGQTGTTRADVNTDGVVNINDLILVAEVLDADTAAAPSVHPGALETLTVADVKLWLSDARQLDLTDPRVQRGILFLEQLLMVLVPKETALLANYPNPFNPETWIPYHLANDTDVSLFIYDMDGALVRELDLGHQHAGYYTDRSRAAYWDGRNAVGESVASGVYFYQLSAGDYLKLRKMVILK